MSTNPPRSPMGLSRAEARETFRIYVRQAARLRHEARRVVVQGPRDDGLEHALQMGAIVMRDVARALGRRDLFPLWVEQAQHAMRQRRAAALLARANEP